ncbi:uncharacterized protein LOC102193852 isoform X2 [Pundamilia nyererei]|uniref:Uncharacterized protein LOC102193852 isoform X2 n=1 Tax=Pundamilia nyererei TaxID=303518 RepID=A0A9Y6JDF7_9CICH|nr:PREDICTED: uncharacterized protein LOC102193852 isoform X2 [Pundamilia nyererei]XP_026002126.1 uncharacterized protein LOC113008707 isoform X2 [Astatotilapia calliptera]
MGNLLFSTGLIRTDATKSDKVNRRHLIAKTICNGITYYYTPLTGTGCETECLAKNFQDSAALCPTFPVSPSAEASSTLLSDSPSNTSVSYQKQSYSSSTSRPLLVFFSWLGAQPGGMAKYRDLYLDRGMDVLLVQSSVMHFLWPRWGLEYGLEVLKILENPPFAGRVMLVHASSIGGYTFTQILTHIVQEPKKHGGLAQRMMGHIYDSLVVGTLDHMAIDFYETSIQVFHNSPVTAPALFFFSENDAMCNTAVMEKLIDVWRQRGVDVHSRKWKKSIHAAHLRCHPDDYLSTLQHFLNSLPISSCKKTI